MLLVTASSGVPGSGTFGGASKLSLRAVICRSFAQETAGLNVPCTNLLADRVTKFLGLTVHFLTVNFWLCCSLKGCKEVCFWPEVHGGEREPGAHTFCGRAVMTRRQDAAQGGAGTSSARSSRPGRERAALLPRGETGKRTDVGIAPQVNKTLCLNVFLAFFLIS